MRDNRNTYWSVGEMRKLAQLKDTGSSYEELARVMGRTVGACKDRLGKIRVAYVLNRGSDDQTAKDFRKIEDLAKGI